jgi:hypothetical protein
VHNSTFSKSAEDEDRFETNEAPIPPNSTIVRLSNEAYPGRKSGDTYLKIDPETERFPTGADQESTSCKTKIYDQKMKRYTLNPPYLYAMYDKGLFTAYKFNKCYFTPYHIHQCNKYGDYPHSYKIQYDKKTSKYRLQLYQDGTGESYEQAGDVGCKGPIVKTTEWMTLDEFNKKYVQIGFFMNESPLKLANESIDYAAYTSYNPKKSSCQAKHYGERLYYKYDIYWSFNADQDGWYLVQYKIIQKTTDKAGTYTLGRFDQYWGEDGSHQVQTTWCLDGELQCGGCYGADYKLKEYVQCGENYVE